jgi:hypothetical protein
VLHVGLEALAFVVSRRELLSRAMHIFVVAHDSPYVKVPPPSPPVQVGLDAVGLVDLKMPDLPLTRQKLVVGHESDDESVVGSEMAVQVGLALVGWLVLYRVLPSPTMHRLVEAQASALTGNVEGARPPL